ncbi:MULTISPECIES: helix-turn-helix domain-containing protein [Rahnella]
MSIKTVSAPYIFGMAQVLYPEKMGLLAIEHISDGVIYRLESQRAIEIISKKQCWSSLAHFLAFQVGFLSSRYYDISHRSSYLVIKSLLLEMNNEPDEIIQNYSIEKYISERCYLGRSGIMKILSDLRKGGYIEIKRGRLIKINKLPEKY